RGQLDYYTAFSSLCQPLFQKFFRFFYFFFCADDFSPQNRVPPAKSALIAARLLIFAVLRVIIYM
ncbi:MAG: hypothetical protein ACI3XO_05335, partial [Eubacteriales bacterium]